MGVVETGSKENNAKMIFPALRNIPTTKIFCCLSCFEAARGVTSEAIGTIRWELSKY